LRREENEKRNENDRVSDYILQFFPAADTRRDIDVDVDGKDVKTSVADVHVNNPVSVVSPGVLTLP
jgi:hypothetical protein